MGFLKRVHALNEPTKEKFVGYRMDNAYGSGIRDLKAVVKHEVSRGTIPKPKQNIEDLINHGYKEVVWLMEVRDDLVLYDPLQEERDWDVDNFDIDKWTIKNPVILYSGGIGTLVAYKPGDEKIE